MVAEGEAVPGLIIVKFADGARVRASNPQGLDARSSNPDVLRQRLRELKVAHADLDRADLAFLGERGLDREDLAGQLEQFRRILDDAPILGWNQLHRQPDDVLRGLRANAELITGRRAADLANYYWVQVEPEADLRPLMARR